MILDFDRSKRPLTNENSQDPKILSARRCLPRPVLKELNNDDYLALQFTQPDWAHGVRHTLESSPDHFVWTQHHNAVIETEDIAESPYEKVWMLDPEPVDPHERRFLRLRTEEDNGIYTTVECVPDEGVVVTVDASKWIDDRHLTQEEIGGYHIERATSPDGSFASWFSGSSPDHKRIEILDESATNGKTLYYRAKLSYVDGGPVEESPTSNVGFVHVTCGWDAAEFKIQSLRPL